MAKTGCQIGCSIFFVTLALFCLGGALFMFIGFQKIYDKTIDKQIVLQREEDGQLTKSTFWFIHPPADALSHYYMFNVLNPNEIEFYGAKPILAELGPFVVRETENKWNYSFEDDDKILRYQNYKTFTYEREMSCGRCKYDTYITIPNLVGIGTLEELLDPRYNVSSNEAFLIDLLMLLVGEYPFVRVRFGDLLFDGYEDPMLTAAHSELLDDLAKWNGGHSIIPVPVPDMTLMAFFFNYNNTNDEVYEIYTGKDNLDKVGKIKKWADQFVLPELWWDTLLSRQIKGSDSGGMQKPNLNKTEPISLFQSYMCRSFDVEYKGKAKYRDLDTLHFEGGVFNYDTTLPEQRGFSYSNSENVDYYPDWPCPITNSTTTTTTTKHTPLNCTNVDCYKVENMCTACCNGSMIEQTRVLPPSMYPINCFPGRVKATPFRLLFTIPHFGTAPPQVFSSIEGLHQLGEQSSPFSFKYLARTGVCVEANIRFQVAIPIYQTSKSVMASNFPNKILPVFWVDNAVQIKENVYKQLHTGFVVVPKVALALKISLPILFVVCLALALLIICVNRKVSSRVEISSDTSRL